MTDCVTLLNHVEQTEPQLAEDQMVIHNNVMAHINSERGIIFWVAPGGTGKTFFINLILTKVHSSGHVTLAAARSEIAAQLLQGRQTAHYTFKIPLNLTGTETPMCAIKRGSALASLFQ